ncbi:MAG: hypothetical protein KA144_16240 [Xanthomonadaceae bacterium]|nr:hypothetical protein [Xanthomonadaceae bacterium]
MNNVLIKSMLALVCFPIAAQAVELQKTCHCDLVRSQPNQVLYNLTTAVNWKPKIWVVSPADQNDCRNKCDVAFANNKQTIATALCTYPPSIAPDQLQMTLLSKLGANTQTYTGKTYTLNRKPVVKCPIDWRSNSNNQMGGITEDGRCKKEFALPAGLLTVPRPSDGTPIGTWGFWWGDGLVAWNTSANGGNPTPAIPAQLKCSISP